MKIGHKILLAAVMYLLLSSVTWAQTSGFTYQGKLGDTGAPAHGVYQFECKLFDADTDGKQIGSTQTVVATVQSGAFTTRLDFGATAFPADADRWLEISVRLNGSGDAYSVLSPRQQVNSVPFSVRSLKSTNADNANTATTAGNVTGVVQITNGGTGSATQNFVDLTSNQTIGGNKTFSGTLSGNVVQAATQYIFGDGSDGDVTITTATTLTRDMYYHNLTISDFMSLNPGGYRIFVSGTLTLGLGASIARDGNAGTGSSGGAGLGVSQLNTLGLSADGGTMNNFGGDEVNSLGGSGGLGGGTRPTGGTAAVPFGSAGGGGVFRSAIQALSGRSLDGVIVNGGAGGGGGAIGTGGGGGGGGVVVVSARTVVLSLGTAVITARGGTAPAARRAAVVAAVGSSS